MKYPSSTMVISFICISLVMGFTPQKQRYQLVAPDFRENTDSSVYNHYLGHFGIRIPAMKMQLDGKSSFESAGRRIDENVAMLSNFWRKARQTFVAVALIPVLLGVSASSSRADDELAKFAAAGHTVGVDGKCFLQKCPLETSECANDRTCLKGLSCLARYIEKLLHVHSSRIISCVYVLVIFCILKKIMIIATTVL